MSALRTEATRQADQAQLPIFRGLLVVQVLVAGLFGFFPYLAPDAFAALFGLTPGPVLVYRLAGAASLGYAAMALAGLFEPSWYTLRISAVASLAFNVAAVVGALLSLLGGEVKPLVIFIAVAASAFALVAAYWVVRDRGAEPATTWPVVGWFRLVLLLATLAAAFFGLAPLLAPGPFATLSGLPGGDPFVYRLAGAATFGYAVSGVLELRRAEVIALRVPVVGALVFNVLGAIAALLALTAGQGGLLAPVVAVAAGLFSLAFAYWLSATGSLLRG